MSTQLTRVPTTTDSLADLFDPDAATSCSGDLAAEVFARLDEGLSPTEIVIEFTVPPDVVEPLWRTWSRMRGHVLVSPQGLEALGKALYCRHHPETSDQVIEQVKRLVALEPRMCLKCGKAWAQYCARCPGEAAREAAVDAGKQLSNRRCRADRRPRSTR